MTDDQAKPASPSRRSLLKGAVLVGLGVSAGTAGIAGLESALSRSTSSVTQQPQLGVLGGVGRVNQTLRIRSDAAARDARVLAPPDASNHDEGLYPNFIGNYSKGLPHNSIGEVDLTAYQALLTAVTSGNPSDFAAIPLGGTTKLSNPQGGLAFALEGTDSCQFALPPAPALAGAERAGEMVEDYWMALARDIPVSQWGNEPTTTAAIADLNKLSSFYGPKVSGEVTARTLFRGLTPGDLVGPYFSQFLLLPVNFGALSIAQMYNTYAAGTDYMTSVSSWLACQNGRGPFGSNKVAGPSYVKNGRDISAVVHSDFPYQIYLTAAQWLLANNAPLNPGNPYLVTPNQSGFQTFGGPHILDLMGELANQALKAVFYQKWFVHRTLRPEEYGGLVQRSITKVASYPVHGEVLNSQAVAHTFVKYGTYLLPGAYPEGGPQHPSYAEGHGAIAGACCTALKAFFNEDFVIPSPVVASDDGQSLLRYEGRDAGEITVGGELDKLASNIGLGRDFAGVHWRSDSLQGILLGEAVAISILEDMRATYNEPFYGFTFTKFDGATATV
jgi:hypothetical protein